MCVVCNRVKRAYLAGYEAAAIGGMPPNQSFEQWVNKYDDCPLCCETEKPDCSKCPACGGIPDNGHDREYPPNPYICSKCMETGWACLNGPDYWNVLMQWNWGTPMEAAKAAYLEGYDEGSTTPSDQLDDLAAWKRYFAAGGQ